MAHREPCQDACICLSWVLYSFSEDVILCLCVDLCTCEQESQEAVKCLTWMLGDELWSSARILLTTEPSLSLTAVFFQCPKYIDKRVGVETHQAELFSGGGVSTLMTHGAGHPALGVSSKSTYFYMFLVQQCSPEHCSLSLLFAVLPALQSLLTLGSVLAF